MAPDAGDYAVGDGGLAEIMARQVQRILLPWVLRWTNAIKVFIIRRLSNQKHQAFVMLSAAKHLRAKPEALNGTATSVDIRCFAEFSMANAWCWLLN